MNRLSPLENEVMQVVWDKKHVSAREVLTTLNTRKDFAYTTIATILTRLNHKKMVARTFENGLNIYYPLVSREEYSGVLAKNFIAKFISSFGDAGVVSFARGLESLNDTQRKKLLTLLEDEKR